jgi:hypothetical protein
MARLCERPGCGERASVSYGFDAERRTMWLEALAPDGPTAGVLCRRHAEAMVVPKGWWLQDRRTDSALFDPPETAPLAPTYRARRPRRPSTTPAEPLPLDGDDAPAAATPAAAPGAEPDPTPAWTPDFDAADDLDGLLDAKTPLLSRAFGRAGGTAAPRP